MSRRIVVASLIWSAALLASRVLGLVRDAVLGSTLGVGPEADVYAAAFRIPDLVGLVISGGALSIVFIPMFTGMLHRGEDDRAWAAFSRVANLVVLLALVLVPLVHVSMPWLAPRLAPGFSPAQLDQLVGLSRIVLPAQVFHLLSGLLGAALLSRDQHAIPALAPLVYNLAIIVGGVIAGSAEGFAWGVLVGAFLGPFLLPLVACARAGLRWSLLLDFGHPDVRVYLRAALPIMFGFSIVGLDDLLWTHAASRLQEGSVSTLNYAKTLMRVPIGVFGFAMGQAAYPTLARLFEEGRVAEAWSTLRAALVRTLVLAFASQVALTVAGVELGTLVYGTARIAPERMSELALALAAFSTAIAAWSAQPLIARGYYAQRETWLPTRLGFVFTIIAWFFYPFASENFGARGLTLASAVTMSAYVLVLYLLLRRRLPHGEGALGVTLRLGCAAVVAVLAGLGARGAMPIFEFGRAEALIRVIVMALVSAPAFVGAAWVFGVGEVKELLVPVIRKIPRRTLHKG